MTESQEKLVLVGLVGPPRSGKTEASTYMNQRYGFRVIRPSRFIRDALVARFGEKEFGRPEYRMMDQELRQLSGPGYYLKGIDLTIGRTLIDGPRHFDTIEQIRHLGGFLIGLTAMSEVRYARAMAATDKLVPPTLEAFLEEERPEMDTGDGQIAQILKAIEPSSIVDTSDLSLEQVQTAIAVILSRNGIEPTDSRNCEE